MKTPMPGLMIILILCSLIFTPSAVLCGESDLEAGPDLETVLAGLEKKYSHKSFEAEFSQETTLAALDIRDDSSGRVWFSHPGKMKWQYLTPSPHEFITNGKTLWFFQPLEGQVSVSSASDFFKGGAGGAFLSDFSIVRSFYEFRIKSSGPDTITLELIPRQPRPDVAAIEITVLKNSLEIRQVLTRNQQDDTTKITFNQVRFTPSDPALFEFTPPEGIEIIKLDTP